MLKLNSKHYIFFILAVSTISLRSYSSIFLRISGRDTYLSVFFASLILMLFFLFIIYTSIKRKNFNFESVFFKVYPKPIALLFLFFILLGFFLTSVESASIYASSIHTNIFIETPVWYCLLFFFIPISYVATKDLKTISYIVLICVFVVLISSFFMFFALLKHKDFSFIFPILFNGISKEIILSFFLSLGSFSSIVIILPYLRFVKDFQHLMKYSGLALIFIIISTTVYFFSMIVAFGPLRAGNIFYPEFIYYQRLQLHGFLECGEFFYILRIVFIYSLKYLLCFKSITLILDKRIRNKNVFTILFSFLAFLLSLYFASNQFFLFSILRYYQLVILIIFFILPLLTYTIYFFKTRKSSHKKNTFQD
ncbi:MAG: GerAB/ArcD/ProY family transporter [Clostridium sp.]